MAGYVTKLAGYVYDGSHLSYEDLTNGVFAEITGNGVEKTAAAKDTVMQVLEKTELWGANAVRLSVVSVGADDVYFVENEWDVEGNASWNEAEYVLPAGNFVRMKRLLPGEHVIMTVDSTLYAALTPGDLVAPDADGLIAAYSPAGSK